jgi:hypothetical protein
MRGYISSLYIGAHFIHMHDHGRFEVEDKIDEASCRSSWPPPGYICNHVVKFHARSMLNWCVLHKLKLDR